MSAVATSKVAASFQSYSRMGTHAGNRAASLGAAQTLTTFLGATGSAEDEDKAKSLFETYKDSGELNNSLSRSVESNKDALRNQKINKAKERIERLKEMLRFATPEQAKRLLKELKQVAKEFKSASQDLKSAGQSLSGGATGADALAGVSNATGTPTVTADTGTLVAGAQAPVTGVTATASISDASVPTSTPEAGTASPASDGKARGTDQAGQSQEGQGQTDQSQDGEDQDGSSPEEQKSGSWKEDLKAAILTYAERQQETDRAHTASRRSGLQGDKEALAKMADDIKSLAAQIERLLKRDDRDSKKDLKDVREDLKDGIKALRDTNLTAEPEVPSTVATGSTDAVFAANVTANVSVQVSDIVV
ncbi:hypothetical protein SIAM614_07358 [Roseibium aggregatum IAM 12614]|uniref:Uncharacterized protein n=1 Tax=Roseibium aggregatum (strain ATCC 25650 / DSM 13394 / JCM 20685 / NBRC 16684 / NCIMB 2208 / IAM 12614 / B1) TaxID=384765 RepID=A0NR97_ROSAI|nr:hypothetical protein [Roseibium aggregatum]EAV44678.1 hypothetical protein SIAM614_07358 [Roseibium aggregatum IAM 12614]